VQARVLKVDPESQKFSLSVKHLTVDPWSGIEIRFKKGNVVAGRVSRVADFGVFVELADGIEGLVHISELSREKVDNPNSLFKAGDEVGAVVLAVDRANKKISLSVRAYQDETERKNMESYMSKPSNSSENLTVLGEALRAKLKINSE
jgi:small subunit ribosomal protein S1